MRCEDVVGAADPWLVEWDPAEKVRIQSASMGGIVLAKYGGCGLELLTDCQVAGSYSFTPTTKVVSTEYITSRTDLFAKIPLGALRLAGEFRKGDKWSLDYVLVGTQDASIREVSRTSLEGRCSEATHFIRGMVVGAYRLVSESGIGGGAKAQAFGASAGGSASQERGLLRHDGDFHRCIRQDADVTDPACQSLVKLHLKPIGGEDDVVISLSSEPAGASVRLDGKLLCESAPCVATVSRGSHLLSMSMKNYVEKKETVTLEEAQSFDWKLEPNFGFLSVLSSPTGLNVQVDGEDVGTTPLVKYQLSVGDHNVIVGSTCYAEAGELVEIQKGREQQLRVSPSFREGQVEVSARDEAGQTVVADVYVDGWRLGSTPGKFRVTVCAQELRVRSPGYSDYVTRVSVREAENVEVTAYLRQGEGTTPPEPTARPVTAEQQPQLTTGLTAAVGIQDPLRLKTMGHVFFFSGVGIAAFGGIATYLGYRNGYEYTQTADSDRAETSRTWAGLMWTGYGLGAAAMTTGIILWILSAKKPPATAKGFAGTLHIDGDGIGLTLSGRW